MEIKRHFKRIISILFLLVIFLVNYKNIYAASGSISVLPQDGEYEFGQTFDVSIKIDGGGQAFNAAKAKVDVSSNLKVKSLSLGDCGFAFVNTPSTASLSFTGVILGDLKLLCTLYTATLQVEGTNNGFVFISDGSIKSYKGAFEILSAVHNSSYRFKSSGGEVVISSPTPTSPPLLSMSNEKLYTVIYGIKDDDGKVSNLKVVLDDQTENKMTAIPAPSSSDATVLVAIFDNVVQGVHTIDLVDGDTKVSQEIVNLDGQNREISLGVTPKASSSFIWYALAGIIIVGIISIIIIGIVFILKKRRQVQI